MAERGSYIPHKGWKKPEIKREEQKIINKTEISLVLDTYDDVYTDFDSRPYSQRALSQDFLDECRRASRDKPHDGFELNLMVPKHLRKPHFEIMIKKRLHEHFRKHLEIVYKELGEVIKTGWKLLIGGLVMMFIGTYLHMLQSESFFSVFIIVVLEPGGWFLFWSGLDHLLFTPKRSRPELDFYKKMSQVKIDFLDY